MGASESIIELIEITIFGGVISELENVVIESDDGLSGVTCDKLLDQ